METNALLFAVIKRHEIRDVIDALPTQAPWSGSQMTDEQRREMVAFVNHPTFWPTFDANYADRMLGIS